MSDKELRRLLHEVIDDLDAGRIQAPRGRLHALGRRLGPPLLAAGLGLGLAGCDARAIGMGDDAGTPRDAVAARDADAQPDDIIAPAYSVPWIVDGGPTLEYMAPPIDAGGDYLYAAPGPDAGPPDAGDSAMYTAPPIEQDAGLVPTYGVPGCEPPTPDDDPDEDPA